MNQITSKSMKVKSVYLSRDFHETTKEMNQISRTYNMKSQYKIYSNTNGIDLDLSKLYDDNLFINTLVNRVSTRDYTKKNVLLEDLSLILKLSNGLNTIDENRYRYIPSAGGRFPIEIYIVELEGSSLKKGVYHYNVKEDTLEFLKAGDYRQELFEYSSNQECVLTCSNLIIMSCNFERTQEKYGERGYRYILMDAGHICQNMYLTATYLNLGFVAIGGFNDNEINKLVGIDGVDETTLYLGCLGTL